MLQPEDIAETMMKLIEEAKYGGGTDCESAGASRRGF
jgi:hypothetical protein